MSRTPAAHLAGLKTRFPAWSIGPMPEGGYQATGPQGTVTAPGLPLLEARLIEATDAKRGKRKAV
jgi:hypothetical protein